MIRLTHQFDPAYARAPAASPKSGGCCCCSCCCCAVTTLGASVVTARSLRTPVARSPVPLAGGEGAPAEKARAVAGLRATFGGLLGWKLFGFFLLPSSAALGFALFHWWPSSFPMVIALLAWAAGMVFLVARKRLSWLRALAVFLLTPVFALLEAFLWVKLFF